MSLRGAAQLAELGSYDSGFGDGSQHADGRLAAFQLVADPLAIRIIESQILVVERAQQPTAYQPCGQPDGGDQGHDGADTGTLAPAALADLVSLELALLVQDQDADRIPLRRPRLLQRGGCRAGRYLVFE